MHNKIISLLPFTVLLLMICSGCRICKEGDLINMGNKEMITDSLENASLYHSMHPLFNKAFDFLKQPGLACLSTGKYEIDGDKLFCIIAKETGRGREEATLEAHRKYIDIQYVIDGTEEMGWKPTRKCKNVKSEYDAKKDIVFYNDEPDSWSIVQKGSFAIFFPEDAHAPLVSDGKIHKVVIKVLVD